MTRGILEANSIF